MFDVLPDPGIRGLWASGGLGDLGVLEEFVHQPFDFGRLDYRFGATPLEQLVTQIDLESHSYGPLRASIEFRRLTAQILAAERLTASTAVSRLLRIDLELLADVDVGPLTSPTDPTGIKQSMHAERQDKQVDPGDLHG